jgi:hypothetical protein
MGVARGLTRAIFEATPLERGATIVEKPLPVAVSQEAA